MTNQEIYEKLDITEFSEEAKRKIVTNLINIVEQRFADLVQGLATDEQLAELNSVSDSGDIAEVAAWINDTIPRASELYQAVLVDTVDDMKDRFDAGEQRSS